MWLLGLILFLKLEEHHREAGLCLFVIYDIYEVQTLPFYKIIDDIHLH